MFLLPRAQTSLIYRITPAELDRLGKSPGNLSGQSKNCAINSSVCCAIVSLFLHLEDPTDRPDKRGAVGDNCPGPSAQNFVLINSKIISRIISKPLQYNLYNQEQSYRNLFLNGKAEKDFARAPDFLSTALLAVITG